MPSNIRPWPTEVKLLELKTRFTGRRLLHYAMHASAMPLRNAVLSHFPTTEPAGDSLGIPSMPFFVSNVRIILVLPFKT